MKLCRRQNFVVRYSIRETQIYGLGPEVGNNIVYVM